jgi:hypothetical protein
MSMGRKLFNIKWVFWFYLQFLFELFLILRRIKRAIVINVKSSSRRVPVIIVRFELEFNFLVRFSKNIQMSNFKEIRLVGADLLHADGRS